MQAYIFGVIGWEHFFNIKASREKKIWEREWKRDLCTCLNDVVYTAWSLRNACAHSLFATWNIYKFGPKRLLICTKSVCMLSALIKWRCNKFSHRANGDEYRSVRQRDDTNCVKSSFSAYCGMVASVCVHLCANNCFYIQTKWKFDNSLSVVDAQLIEDDWGARQESIDRWSRFVDHHVQCFSSLFLCFPCFTIYRVC